MNALGVFGILLMALGPVAPAAATDCPPEVAQAKAALASARDAARKSQVAREQDIQAPRAQAGARQDVQAPRGQDVQAPRGQDVQAPRGQDVQAPRGQDVQAPRGQDVQAPRGQDIQAPRGQDVQAPRGQNLLMAKLARARALVRQAEQTCQKGDMALSAQKAREAIELLK